MTFRETLIYVSAACMLVTASAAWAGSRTPITALSVPECLAPAKPGGGMDLTCKLIQKGMLLPTTLTVSQKNAVPPIAIRTTYLPGGIGAVAWNAIVTQRSGEAQTLVAFSGGSLMNLAQGKYGRASPANVRWVAAVGADYGMIAVRSDSPFKNLRDLMQALKDNPSKVTIGAAGTVGSQDWLKISLLARKRHIDPKTLRFVALEGGGESFTALRAGHVQAVSGDASEAMLHAADNEIRILAVLSDNRLPGALANVPTAREQGIDVSWPIIRGVYMGPHVSDADYHRWINVFDQMMATPEFDRLRTEGGLFPFSLTGKALTEYVKKTVYQYGQQANAMGLVR
ncbi:tripartite tricarboxylate transporter substrate binding protein [Glaciimonas sp. PAMC28666]|uniref:Bug family tripartite tricarboxylate transporter substrate binding protein n=1 Tax=Glaciimonas sp. PAMC28666 TaxID=2807626 RepID=UPI0019643720|nr:tripartite tricarboxylate transporter substrate-binding protein [Glaciimonas sp. PAMC28666]QRX84255.1 tripartite tricarboxylate transporter substrate binding protein [Glaciimonas sp. PAMC28666]